MGSRMGLIGWLVIVVAILQLRGATAETVYTVGDSLGWAVPPNTSYYSTWATTNLQTFLLGDSLEFNWTGTHIVAEVSKADYDNCTKVSSGSASPFKFTPPTVGSYYIICTVDDHCERGQKFSFTVNGSSAEPPTSAASSLTLSALFAVMSTTFIYLFLGLSLN
ncbi:umecyanin-like [Corylus avellana]|uniref:umecyanin-like n=1 Tax=Corylus avellana TaxID=13451 RepID=UPI00286D1E34|nr:umecyanin-like [Corylus avellana]